MATDPGDWDPRPEQRQLLRNCQNGNLGWLVRRNGKSCVKLDNPRQDITVPYIESDWRPEEVQRPLALMHAARIAFEADKALCKELGMRAHARRDWPSLSDGERQLFMTSGPKIPPRSVLYQAVMGALQGFVRPK